MPRILYQGDEWGARFVADDYAETAKDLPPAWDPQNIGGAPETYVVERDPGPEFSHRVVAYEDHELVEMSHA